MKHWITLLLACLLLSGCGAVPAPTEASPIPASTAVTAPTEPSGYYDPTDPLELATNGAIRCYPLDIPGVTGIFPMGDDLLLLSSDEDNATLTVLTGETLYPTATLSLEGYLYPGLHHLSTREGGVSFYNDAGKETLVLDESLRTISRIPDPQDSQGIPLLSADRKLLYYCTSDAIQVLDLESGIPRRIRETAGLQNTLMGLHFGDRILQVLADDGSFTSETLFLSTENGAVLGRASGDISFDSIHDVFYASFWEGSAPSYVFGPVDAVPQTFLPSDPNAVEGIFLPEANAALTLFVSPDAPTRLEYYDLYTGSITARLDLAPGSFPWGFAYVGGGKIGFLDYHDTSRSVTLYLWDTAASPWADSRHYTDTYYTKDAPDYDGLAACSLYAQEISQRYGLDIRIYKDAVCDQPWDYTLEYEHRAPVLRQELEELDSRLSNYPEGFLETLNQRFDGVSICLVRSIQGSAQTGSLDNANGIQFWVDNHALIVLAAGQETERTLYHELCHLIDTIVLNESGAYDRWDELNPTGFSYDYDYIANQSRNSGEYLREESRYFIDMYSMSYPKEDRARIMEYAMTDGNAAYFQSQTMQAKLKLLCQGIREAFGLRKSPETFLWEQYLKESLAYSS